MIAVADNSSARFTTSPGIDRLTISNLPGCALHLYRIARVGAAHGEGGDEDRTVDADLVYRASSAWTWESMVVTTGTPQWPGNQRGRRKSGHLARIRSRMTRPWPSMEYSREDSI